MRIKQLMYGCLVLMFVGVANLAKAQIKTGAESMSEYLPMLTKKKVALVINNTSMVGKTMLVDTLLRKKVKVVKIFTPEHGLKGTFENGAQIENSIYGKKKIPVISLYGNNRKPDSIAFQGIDYVVFDIQDVGVRFYTYISTLSLVMEACAEQKVPLIVLDRPNPNGFYVDGPVLKPEFASFVGMHPVPLVYGMTIGEYAQMVNGEGWLKNGVKCELTVIKCKGYTHDSKYNPPVPPSPNLKTIQSIYLYPSLGLFEGTDVSVGRGTDRPFEIIGKPGFAQGKFTFTPQSIPGVSDNPPYKGKLCNGFDVKDFGANYIVVSQKLYLLWLTGFYEGSADTANFFNPLFDKLAGSDQLRKQIISKTPVEKISESWEPELEKFMQIRKKYLLYQDFSAPNSLIEIKPSNQ